MTNEKSFLKINFKNHVNRHFFINKFKISSNYFNQIFTLD
jgi:hypothetical protein